MILKTNKKTGMIQEVIDTTHEVFLRPINEASFKRSSTGIRVAACYIPKNRPDINDWFARFTVNDPDYKLRHEN